ncbi:MAG: hypothetical protein M1828_000542 [Chrysothrix sp. TS-e1954]|nr:MAG: hypothetical protein M1828_000542 [Chrysothrix sp. TS-e1954]
MPLAKSKNSVGLGNSLMNDRFGKNKGHDMRRAQGIQRTGADGQTYITTPKQEASYMKMRSVTEQPALDEFLATAELKGTDFTAERMNNVKIIHRDQKNPFLLSAAEERAAIKKQSANKERLKVPRRPQWTEEMLREELDAKERESLLIWRQGLAALEERDELLMTPFERNIEVWRQLWRVIERSDLVVQIVDARNPLLFRCEDLEKYVKEVDAKKNNLLLVNKADMMTLEQRQIWADFFDKMGINFRFFSAELSKSQNQLDNIDSQDDESDVKEASEGDDDDAVAQRRISDGTTLAETAEKIQMQDGAEDEDQWASEEDLEDDEKPEPHEQGSTRIITTEDLEALFLEHSPQVGSAEGSQARKTTIGLVGYPNVGKSSTINALIGAKKVSVSATPGKTKHFQTIHLSDSVILCDCPGLVFPNFATTKAELVCNGVLPIDQLREYTGPAGLVAQRIPQSFLEAVYGLRIDIRPIEEGGTGIATAEEVLRAYASARGFSTTGLGQPDESRAARYVLKDYVKGKLLFCHAPPNDPPIDENHFNRELYDVAHLPQKRRAGLAVQEEFSLSGSQDPSLMDHPEIVPGPRLEGQKSKGVDKRFFAPGQGNAGHIVQPFQHKYSEHASQSGRHLSGRKLKTMIALEKDIDPTDVRAANSKKHFKGNKRNKVRGEAY